MADDPYKVLGVARDASAEQIRAAYRKLAKTHHPDLNPGNKKAEEAFKALNTAYDLLGDQDKRAKFDRGELDAAGNERAPQFHPGAGGFGGGGFEDMFANIFEQRARGPARGQDERYLANVSFLEAVNGGTKRIDLPSGQSLDVKIPPGASSGDVLRLRAKGAPGRNGGPAGDALIELQVQPHRFFRREGRAIHLDLPVSLKEAVLGGKVTVPTPSGDVVMTLKPHTEGGTELRLRGKGVPAHGHHHVGDLLVKLVVKIGPVDEALEAFLKGWAQADFHPREKL
ncbi:J domain-containing protein [Acidocella sp.]|uniref:J domain-containing protein n=1 Tax=Acidocella sp. TaxID=50710 RepID=UPI002615AA1B|nr:J domain-containing protein [Acidocella sp.]